jgi:amino acid transporter
MTTDQAKGAETGKPRYRQELDRSIGVLGNIFITLSGITPAVSVFVIAPGALLAGGTGAFLSYVLAAAVGVFMALCWAELSAAFPIAGGDYAMVWHSFRGNRSAERLSGPVSFVTFMLWLDFIAFIPATIALGAGLYLSPIISVSGTGAKVVGAIFMLAAAALAALKIKFNSWMTGIFLGIEMLALVIVTFLGLFHAHHWGALIHPTTGASPVAFSVVVSVTAIAIFSYNGYAGAVNFAEETTGSSRNIAKAILWSLVITVAAELIPLTATIIGSPSIGKLIGAPLPMQYFIEATSSKGLYDVISIGIVLATLNAVLAIVLAYARVMYSAARDNAFFPPKVNKAMTQIHPKWGSPWIATIVIGVVGAILCLTVSLNTLINLTGASLVADYALIALAAFVARLTKATTHSPYRMGRWWPIPPLLAMAALGYVFTVQTRLLLTVTLITMAIGLIYWAAVIMPQRGKAWTLLDAAATEEK